MLKFALLDDIPHVISTRHGGVSSGPYRSLNLGYSTPDDESAIATNRERLVALLGMPATKIVSGWLTHGNEVSVFRKSDAGIWPVGRFPVRQHSARTEDLFKSDAVVSDVGGLGFVLTFADCVPLLFFDPRRHVLGAAHAGWRGTAQGIAGEVVGAMRREFGCRPGDIRVGIGPSIGPCCYTVSAEVGARFAECGQKAYLETRDQKQYLDLWASNASQMIDLGVPRHSIENPRACTSCRRDLYFSHRAEHGQTGRFGLCAALP